MKKLKNGVLTLVVALGAVSFANAQKFDAGVHVVPSLPMGDFGELFDFGIGGQVFGEYFLNENFHVGAEVGYLSYSGELDLGPFGSQDYSMSLIPIQATAAYHTDAEGEFDFYAGTGVGLFMFGGDMESSSEIGFSPRAGVSLELTSELRANGGLSYMYVLTEGDAFTALNINLGITYTLWD